MSSGRRQALLGATVWWGLPVVNQFLVDLAVNLALRPPARASLKKSPLMPSETGSCRYLLTEHLG